MENLKILIAEDNGFTRKFYDSTISGQVFDKKFAENGQEALALYEEWQPDIILLDLMMPVMSGQEMLKEIRETRKDNATTIVVFSLSSRSDDVEICARYGVQGYLVKPINPRGITRTLLKFYKDSHPERAVVIDSIMQEL